jgi:endoglucanase
MKKTKLTLHSALFFVFALNAAALAQAPYLNLTLPPADKYVPPAGSPVAKHGHLSIVGNRMKAEPAKGGHDVQLRGMSFFWSNSGEGRSFYNDGVVGWMVHDWKVDVLRPAIGAADDPSAGGGPGYIDGPGPESEQWTRLKTVVEGAIRRGIYVIVDWHSHRATAYQNESVAFFRRVAKEWGKYPNIIYEIYNEPCAHANRCANEDWGRLVSYSNAVISAIRSEGSNNVVIAGTRGFSSLQDPGQINQNPVNDPINLNPTINNIAYSLHFYNDVAHQNFMGRATELLNFPGHNKAVFVSEFGLSSSNGSGDIGNEELTRISNWFTYLDNNKISWVNWSITNKNETSAIIKNSVSNTTGGWSASGNHLNPNADLTLSGEYIRNRLRASGSGIPDNTMYTITTTAGDGGKLNISPAGPYAYGTQVTLTAAPDSDYEFRNWTGDLAGAGNGTFTFTVRGINLEIGAAFFKGGLIKNGRFSPSFASWSNHVSPLGSGEALTPVVNNSEMTTNITRHSSAADHFQIRQSDLELEAGKGYRLSFRAKADIPRKIAVTVTNGPEKYLEPRELTLTAEWKDFEIDFVVPASAGSDITGRVEFWYGVGPNAGLANWSMTYVSLLEGNYQNGGGDGNNFDPANIESWKTISVSISTPQRAPAAKSAWSVTRVGGGLQLNSPDISGTAKVSLYDVRGRLVKRVTMKSGQKLTLNKTVAPAGNYLLVVRNNSGKDVYKTRISLIN